MGGMYKGRGMYKRREYIREEVCIKGGKIYKGRGNI